MWELDHKESWAWRIDAFERWCWRRLFWGPWTVRSNQSILREISPEYSLEGLVLKLKLKSFGHPMQRDDSLEKTLMLGGIEGRRRRDNRGWDGWMASPTQCTWVWTSSWSWWWTGRPDVMDREVWHAAVREVTKIESDTTEWLIWTEWGFQVPPRRANSHQLCYFVLLYTSATRDPFMDLPNFKGLGWANARKSLTGISNITLLLCRWATQAILLSSFFLDWLWFIRTSLHFHECTSVQLCLL